MKCQKCGAENPDESRLCSACGAEIEQATKAETADLIYETLRLYEQLDLDAALAKCKEALSVDPDSPSARSLLGLIYEKLADREKTRGNIDQANDYYSAAIRQIERVLEDNPDSVADREKLQELRAKLGLPEPEPSGIKAAFDSVVEFVRKVPPAYTAAVASCAVVFVILGALMGNGASEQAQNQNARKSQGAQTSVPVQTYPQQQPQQSAPAWTYQPPNAQDETEQPAYPSPQPSNTYQPVPQIPQPVRPDTSPKPAATTGTPSSTASDQPKVVVPNPPQPEKSPAERAREAMSRKDYAAAVRLYEEAISHGENTAENHQQLAIAYYRSGREAKAEEHFQKAIKLYQDRKARGIDVAGADAGIRACQDYLGSIRE